MNEIYQLTLTISMFIITSLSDVKTRSINDKIWIVCGIIGIIIQALSDIECIECVIIVSAICIGITFYIWLLKIISSGDMFVMIALSIIVPKLETTYFIPIIVLFEALVISSIYASIVNLKYNLKDIRSGKLFQDVDESTIKKVIAIFVIHKKRKDEKFTFSGTMMKDGKLKFQFLHNPNTQEFTESADYVSIAIPFIPFFLIAFFLTISFIWMNSGKSLF